MRTWSLVVGLSLWATACTALDQWIKTPAGAFEERLNGAAGFEANPVDRDLRTSLCGFRLERTAKLRVEGIATTIHGDKTSGKGEAQVKLAGASGGAEALVCEGTVTFAYRYHPAGKHPSYYEISDVERKGPPLPIVATIEARAVGAAIDAPVPAFEDGFRLPDGRVGTALAVEIPEAGRYAIRYGKKYPVFGEPVASAYQRRRVIPDGDGTGALGFWILEKGRTVFLVSSPDVAPTDVRVVRYQKTL
jgi:hypothetical protein